MAESFLVGSHVCNDTSNFLTGTLLGVVAVMIFNCLGSVNINLKLEMPPLPPHNIIYSGNTVDANNYEEENDENEDEDKDDKNDDGEDEDGEDDDEQNDADDENEENNDSEVFYHETLSSDNTNMD